MNEELKIFPANKSPAMMALMTFISFIIIGFIPLITYVFKYSNITVMENLFLHSCIFTAGTFMFIGYLKSFVTKSPKIKGIFETLLLGGIAAALAYYTGNILEKILSR